MLADSTLHLWDWRSGTRACVPRLPAWDPPLAFAVAAPVGLRAAHSSALCDVSLRLLCTPVSLLRGLVSWSLVFIVIVFLTEFSLLTRILGRFLCP